MKEGKHNVNMPPCSCSSLVGVCRARKQEPVAFRRTEADDCEAEMTLDHIDFSKLSPSFQK